MMYEGEDMEEESFEMENEFYWECAWDMASSLADKNASDAEIREIAQEKFYEMTGGYHR